MVGPLTVVYVDDPVEPDDLWTLHVVDLPDCGYGCCWLLVITRLIAPFFVDCCCAVTRYVAVVVDLLRYARLRSHGPDSRLDRFIVARLLALPLPRYV